MWQEPLGIGADASQGCASPGNLPAGQVLCTRSNMNKDNGPVKLGAGPHPIQSRHHHSNTWLVQRTTGPDRITVGPSTDHVDLLLELANCWPGPYYLLYVLLTPRDGLNRSGRYQSEQLLSMDQIRDVCETYRDYLQGDGRHNVWIGSPRGKGLVIYDHHELIYGYGPIQEYINVVTSRGLVKGTPVIPSPHTHNYHPAFDNEERKIMQLGWIYSPLQNGDD